MNGRASSVWVGARQRIHMQEVGTRDGLQVEQRFVETREKIALVDALSDAGLAAPMHLAPPATSAPRRSCTRSIRWATTPVST